MDIGISLWIGIIGFVLMPDFCTCNFPPLLISNKYWHVFDDDPVGTIVTRLRAKDLEGDLVTFNLESQPHSQDIHSYFEVDKNWRVLIAKPLNGLIGDVNSKDYILRVRMNDGFTSPISEVRVQVLRGKEESTHKEQGMHLPKVSSGRRIGGVTGLGGRPFSEVESQGPQHIKSDIAPGNLGILGNIGSGNRIGFLPSLWEAHPPLLQVNKTWAIEADAPVGTVVDTIKVVQVAGHNYNLTLHGSRGLLSLNPDTGIVTVASSLLKQVSDLTIMVTVSNNYGDASELVIFKVLPKASMLPETNFSSGEEPRQNNNVIPEPVEVQGQLLVYEENDIDNEDALAEFNKSVKSAKSSTRLTAYTLVCLVLMPILSFICVSLLITLFYCYWQRRQLKKQIAVYESRSRPTSYLPK